MQAKETQPYLRAGGVEIEVAVVSLLSHGEILRASLASLQRNSPLLQRDGCALGLLGSAKCPLGQEPYREYQRGKKNEEQACSQLSFYAI